MKEDNALDCVENLEQYSREKEKIDDDHINPTNKDSEAEKANTNHERDDSGSDRDEG